MEIFTMTLEDLEQMKDTLYSDFDNFWSYNGLSICLDEATLNNIVVKKSYRNRGIGGELLEALIEFCSELRMKTFTLEVDTENEPAIHLYEKFGFKNLGVRKNYYNNSRDAFIMTKYDL